MARKKQPKKNTPGGISYGKRFGISKKPRGKSPAQPTSSMTY